MTQASLKDKSHFLSFSTPYFVPNPEFASKELDLWAYSNNVKLDYSRPGKPTDNAFIEEF